MNGKALFTECMLIAFLAFEAWRNGGRLTTADILQCGVGWIVGSILCRCTSLWWERRQKRREWRETSVYHEMN